MRNSSPSIDGSLHPHGWISICPLPPLLLSSGLDKISVREGLHRDYSITVSLALQAASLGSLHHSRPLRLALGSEKPGGPSTGGALSLGSVCQRVYQPARLGGRKLSFTLPYSLPVISMITTRPVQRLEAFSQLNRVVRGCGPTGCTLTAVSGGRPGFSVAQEEQCPLCLKGPKRITETASKKKKEKSKAAPFGA
ncbi:hypothetical protein BX600DRAFT_138811 [Xylariales sp. PMI_506]|nr:hypothetical protein BX600DRAFT_138811 [Xylariales sp. PMI_506]